MSSICNNCIFNWCHFSQELCKVIFVSLWSLFGLHRTKILALPGPLANHLAHFLTHFSVPRITCCLLQQQRGCTSWAWWSGPCVEYEVQENYPRVRLSLPGTVLSLENKDFMLMSLDIYLPYDCQHNYFIGLAFTLTTCICKQMVIAKGCSLETFFCYRISDIIQNSVLF